MGQKIIGLKGLNSASRTPGKAIAGIIERLDEIEAIFQGMDAADYEALKDTAEVKVGLTALTNRVNDIDNPSVHHIFMGDYGSTSLSDIEEAMAGGKIVIMRAGAGHGMFVFCHMDYSYDSTGEYVFVALTSGNIEWFNFGSLRGYTSIQTLEVQSKLTFDNTPTANSNNPVKSGGIKTALDEKQNALVSGTNIKTINNTSILGSGNLDVNGVFIAEYDVTTYQQVLDAYNAGKIVVVTKDNLILPLVLNHNNAFYFNCGQTNVAYTVIVRSNNVWSYGIDMFESENHKAADFTTLNDVKYPTTKAVADYVSAIVGNINSILETI